MGNMNGINITHPFYVLKSMKSEGCRLYEENGSLLRPEWDIYVGVTAVFNKRIP